MFSTINSGLSNENIYAIKIDSNDNKWSGTSSGIAIYNEGGFVPVEEIAFDATNDFSISQNYPYPFNPSTNIIYSIPTGGYVLIKLYDVLGTEIRTLISETKSVGNYQLTIEGSELNSGVYFYRIQSGSFIDTKKMILMK